MRGSILVSAMTLPASIAAAAGAGMEFLRLRGRTHPAAQRKLAGLHQRAAFVGRIPRRRSRSRGTHLTGNPFLSGGRPRDEWLLRFFNTAAFAFPAEGMPGTAGRSILTGPGASTGNLSAFKNFRVREGHRLQFRTELFGALNHPNFGNPNTAMNNPNFGRILGAGGSRVVPFGLKYLF